MVRSSKSLEFREKDFCQKIHVNAHFFLFYMSQLVGTGLPLMNVHELKTGSETNAYQLMFFFIPCLYFKFCIDNTFKKILEDLS